MSTSLSNINSPYPGAQFVGFSTFNNNSTNTSLYDIDLINQDLYNAFYTRPGERVMRPDYGCKIWYYFMEQLTDDTRNLIVTEATRICNLDSRLTVQNVNVYQQGNGIRVEILLQYAPWNVVNTFVANFNTSEQTYFNTTGNNN